MLKEYMIKWVDELGLPKEIATLRGTGYSIPMDEETTIELKEMGQGFSLFCKIVAVPEKGKEEFYIHMLHGNLLGQATEGASLGLTEEGNYLTLSYDIDYPVDYNQFKDIVEDFFNVVDFWREEARLHKAGKLFPS